MNRAYDKQVYYDWRWYKGIRGINDINNRNYNNFLSYMGSRPVGCVLVRKDKTGGFVPGNVRWGTHSENSKARGPMKKYSYSRDEELIAELERRGYECILAKNTTHR